MIIRQVLNKKKQNLHSILLLNLGLVPSTIFKIFIQGSDIG